MKADVLIGRIWQDQVLCSASGLAAASRRVMNSQSECKYSIHLVVGGPGRSRYRCRRRGTAFVADNAIPAGRRFRVRPILREAE